MCQPCCRACPNPSAPSRHPPVEAMVLTAGHCCCWHHSCWRLALPPRLYTPSTQAEGIALRPKRQQLLHIPPLRCSCPGYASKQESRIDKAMFLISKSQDLELPIFAKTVTLQNQHRTFKCLKTVCCPVLFNSRSVAWEMSALDSWPLSFPATMLRLWHMGMPSL